MYAYITEDRMAVFVLLRKANDYLTLFDTFHCLTRLWKFLRESKQDKLFC